MILGIFAATDSDVTWTAVPIQEEEEEEEEESVVKELINVPLSKR